MVGAFSRREASCSGLLRSVGAVRIIISLKKVVRTNAARIVTPMANPDFRRQGDFVMLLKATPVCSDAFLAIPEDAVAILVLITLPFPAAGSFGGIGLEP